MSRGLELIDALPPDAVWTEHARALAEDQTLRAKLLQEAGIQVAVALAEPDVALEGFELLPMLDACQREAVAVMSVPSLQGLALFDEQGVGKTAMAIAGFDWLRSLERVSKLLVICPKSTLGGWEREIRRLTGDKYTIRSSVGAQVQRRRHILTRHDILLTTYESATADANLLHLVIKGCSGSYMLIVDESYLVKNPNAKRTQAVRAIRQVCGRAVLLCGTPAPNTPLDVVSQIDLADLGATFRGVTVPTDKDEAKVVIRDSLQRAIYLRRLKEDVLEFVPAKEFQTIPIGLEPFQAHLYAQVRDALVNDLSSVDDETFERQRSNFLARRSTLLQICSHPGALYSDYREVPAKFLTLDLLMSKLISEGEKIVLWSYYRYTLAALEERYAHFGLVRVDGSVESTQERSRRIEAFQSDESVRVFLGNAAAAGAGITLTSARHAIYESLSNQGAHYMQSLDRIHRRGQIHDVVFHILTAKDTVEESHMDTLIEKEQMSRELLPSTASHLVTRLQLLEELTTPRR
jgi:SNF2 family DNA or RNA helicase